VTGPGTVSFWWKVSSETNHDSLRFYVGGSEQARISGEVDWEQRTFVVPAGTQELKWKFKNRGMTGQDRGWVDQIQFAGVPPTITRQPDSRSVDAGTTVRFKVVASGTPPLYYQWQFNGVGLTNGGSASGATTASLTLTNVQPAQAGNYTVVVSNAVGSVTSSNAVLTVTPVLRLAEFVSSAGRAAQPPFSPMVANITVAGGKVVLTWGAKPANAYQVLYKESLSETEWKVLAGDVVVTGSTARHEDAVAGRPRRFYRIVEH
jgi:hypothetical protein